MKSIWHSLFWKELREHFWKLVSLTAVMVALPLLSLLTDPVSAPASVTIVLFPYLALASIYLGAHAAAGESSSNTLPWIQAMPFPRWQLALVKLAAGSATLVLPVLISVAVGFVAIRLIPATDLREATLRELSIVTPWGIQNWFASQVFIGAVGAVSLFLWAVAVGVRRANDVSAAAAIAIVVAGLWIPAFMVAGHLGTVANPKYPYAFAAVGLALLPGGLPLVQLPPADFHTARWGVLAIAVGIGGLCHAGLAYRYLTRFGRLDLPASGSQRSVSPEALAPASSAPPTWRCWRAILWKQWRESRPVVGVSVAAILGSSFLFGVARSARSHSDLGLLESFMGYSLTFGIVFGFFVAIVLGVGQFYFDLGKGVHAFWRSRPINPDQWFLLKFSCGLVLLVGVELVPLNSARVTFPELLPVATVSATFFLAYSAAVLLICVLRHAIYASLLSAGLAFGVAHQSYYLFSMVFAANTAEVLGILFTLMLAVATALLAWVCLRNDWHLQI